MYAFRPAVALGAAAGFFALQSVIPGPLPTAMMLLAIAVPLGCFWIYLATLRRIHTFSALASESLIRRYMPGLWWRLILGWVAGLAGALLVGTQLLAFGNVDWIILALALPVFLGTWKLFGERLRSEILPCYRLGWSLRAATWPAATILALLDVGAIWLRGGVPRYDSLASAIDAGRAGAAMFGDSAIAAVLVQVAGMLNGLQAYALGYLSGGDGGLRAATALLVFGLLSWAFYLTVCFYIASFLVPAREYARVLAPLSDTPIAPAVPPFRAFSAATFSAIALLMLYPAAVASIDHWLETRPWVKEQLDRMR